MNVFFDPEFALQFVQTEQQITHYGLKLSYVSLSIFWPLIIGALTVIFGVLSSKTVALKECIYGAIDLGSIKAEQLSPFSFDESNLSAPYIIFLYKYLPLIGILVHVLSLIYAFFVGANFPDPCLADACQHFNLHLSFLQYSMFFVFNAIGIMLSIIWVKKFPVYLELIHNKGYQRTDKSDT
jgi:hypothetical protein